MINQKEKYRQFKKWQHQPHEVAPLSEEMHECATCGTHFEGNFALLVLPLVITPIKQFSGYSYWSTIWRTIVAFIPFAIILFLIIVAIIFIYSFIYINY